ncbi:MAG: VOC family protein [Thermomicrobiales bacterium]|nr:VOC family protein [Thermomicrobiales bacterium]
MSRLYGGSLHFFSHHIHLGCSDPCLRAFCASTGDPPRPLGLQDREMFIMAVKRLDHAGYVVNDLSAAIAFFVELGLELEGETTVEGEWVDQLVGLDGVRSDIAFLRTPDGHGRIELSTFHSPVSTSPPPTAPVNAPGIPRLTFVVDSLDDTYERLLATVPPSLERSRSTSTSIDTAIFAVQQESSSGLLKSSTDEDRAHVLIATRSWFQIALAETQRQHQCQQRVKAALRPPSIFERCVVTATRMRAVVGGAEPLPVHAVRAQHYQ